MCRALGQYLSTTNLANLNIEYRTLNFHDCLFRPPLSYLIILAVADYAPLGRQGHGCHSSCCLNRLPFSPSDL